jgi:hypothetical protein
MGFHADSTRIGRGFHASRVGAHRAVPVPYPLLGTNPLAIRGSRRSYWHQRRRDTRRLLLPAIKSGDA